MSDVTLMQGDCLELMRGLPDKSVQCVVTDPPYAEKTHAGERSLWSSNGRVAQSVDFEHVDDAWIVAFFTECIRVSSGWVIATIDWRHMLALENMKFLVRFGIWIKPKYTPQISGDRPATGWEAVAICHRAGKKKWNGGGKAAIWSALPVSKTDHPTQKPLGLIKTFVGLFSNEGDTVLDPCAGSGTTGAACVQMRRKFIGMELRKDYFDIAQSRIEAAQAQGILVMA